MTKPIDIYDRGYVDGVRAFAWWKDGKEYVGTCGTLATDAIVNRKGSPGYDPPQCCFVPPVLSADELLAWIVDIHKQLEQYAFNNANQYAKNMAHQAAVVIARANGESPVLSLPSRVL